MLLGPGDFLNDRRKAKRELCKKGYNVILMEDDEETKNETRLDIKFEKILKKRDPVFIAFFPKKARSMEGVIFEIGCICCSYGCEKIGDRLMLLSDKKYDWDKRTAYMNTLFSRTKTHYFDESKPHSKASQRIDEFAVSYVINRRREARRS